jgi:hypothetical protein
MRCVINTRALSKSHIPHRRVDFFSCFEFRISDLSIPPFQVLVLDEVLFLTGSSTLTCL